MGTIPNNIKDSFKLTETWINTVCTKATVTQDSVVRGKWQNTHADRKVLGWMLCHTLFVNSILLAPGPQSSKILDPQESLNKALETVSALNPADKARKYTDTELCCLRAAGSLTETELMTSLPIFHNKLLSEGRMKRRTDAVLTKELFPEENSDDPGLIYVYPKLVADVKD